MAGCERGTTGMRFRFVLGQGKCAQTELHPLAAATADPAAGAGRPEVAPTTWSGAG
ncbi:hypothetical protein [Streptomyces sp. NBC_01320]|uniref:hypothetical protein n=1 Tax=Streptomyces sp. NBC_01320 TaxID=2903824 RepID=UPI002E12A6BF|nr:hypothetical protein OG395_12920 [Streptomyces sp. NBC_01320]